MKWILLLVKERYNHMKTNTSGGSGDRAVLFHASAMASATNIEISKNIFYFLPQGRRPKLSFNFFNVKI
ncbi:hypothetical protein AGR1B_pa0063 [Agrobacterium fabacearum S56]|nr:hypothetical protein AGR1B_pa0063 [Agrobacterium fabacearum S56]